MKTDLPKELQLIVSSALTTLGTAIKAEYGNKAFKRIENLRVLMKGLRRSNRDIVFKKLIQVQKKFKNYSTDELEEITLSFSFLLELINRCENAFRTHQISKKDAQMSDEQPLAIVMVLTAHPTEARSPQLLELFNNIQVLLEKTLKDGYKAYEKELFHLMLIGLKVSLARRKRPTVLNEAENIYSYILRKDILECLIGFIEKDINLKFRTWVGGDKDGHPGVNEKTMLQSLGLSRKMILDFLTPKLEEVKDIIDITNRKNYKKLPSILKVLDKNLSEVKLIKNGDGKKIEKLKATFKQLEIEYKKEFKVMSPTLQEINNLFEVFPALVVPLEIREDSEIVKEALKSKSPLAIEKMLKVLKEISAGGDTKEYVRGFILSMVESHLDIINGYKLVLKVFGNYKLPVVPLFENEKALTNAEEILIKLFSLKKTIPKEHLRKWNGYYEVMVGYSDSSKENGVFSSRYMISNALAVIEKVLKKYKLTPVFFHGSGGSIERGGGSIKVQTGWWPVSALNVYKATVQGEMVARSFSSDQILKRQTFTIIEQLNVVKKLKHKKNSHKVLDKFSELVRHNYSSVISDDDFFEVIDSATPYSFLSHLKIGSRPSKRATGGDSKKLRAIPWILCWTQTRVLFPTWWGTGQAWEQLNKTEKLEFKKQYIKNPLISSFMNALGFTLAKIDLAIWKLYLSESRLSANKKKETYEKFLREFNKTKSFYKDVTGKKEFLWFRPWLQESIYLRSSMIHPLNLIQLEALKRGEIDLLRDTVTGISCGMLTTG
jgi:phosphoenolpyruvate carboxylase